MKSPIKLLGLMFLALIFMGSNGKAQVQDIETTGIHFFAGTYKEALAKAKKEGKMVFVDAYAVWCPPCKLLNKNVFPDQALGEYFNANFVSLKMDMEKGEGKTYMAPWNVKAYPTLIFFDANGKEVMRSAGYRQADQLLELGKQAKSKG